MTVADKKIRSSLGFLWLRILAGSLTFLLSVGIGFVVVSRLFEALPLSDALYWLIISAFLGWTVFRKSSQRLAVGLSAITALPCLVLWLGLDQRYEEASAQPPSIPDNAIAKFTVAPNLNIDGEDILLPTGRIGIPDIDLSTCAAQCNNKQSCVAFSFDRWRQVCYLKNKVVTPLLDPPSLTAVKNGTIPNKSKAPFKIETLFNRRFLGKPNRHTRASDYLACMAACKDDENCVAFSFLKDVGTTDNCQIFENPEQGHIADPSIDSGYKFQIPNMAALPPLAAKPAPPPPAAPKDASPPVATQAAPKEAAQAAREEAARRQAELAPATPPKEATPPLAPPILATPRKEVPPALAPPTRPTAPKGAPPPVAPRRLRPRERHPRQPRRLRPPLRYRNFLGRRQPHRGPTFCRTTSSKTVAQLEKQ